MKTLHTIILIASFIFSSMVFSSCEEDTATDTARYQTAIESGQTTIPDTGNKLDSTEKKAVLDSINIVNSRVNEVFSENEKQGKEIVKIQTELDDYKKDSALSILISWVVAGIAIILAIISTIKASAANSRAGRHRNEIEELKKAISDLRLKPTSNTRQTSYLSSANDYYSLADRISRIERQMKQESRAQTQPIPTPVPIQTIQSKPGVSHEQHGYFGVPSQMSSTSAYFKHLFDTRDSEARFSVIIRNNKAEFNLLEGNQFINEISSNDNIKFALELQGCAPSEATQMRTILPGEAVKEDNRWVIKKKAQIYLSK